MQESSRHGNDNSSTVSFVVTVALVHACRFSSTIFHCQNTCPLHLFYQLASMDLARML